MDRAELTQMLLKVDTKEHTRIPMKFNRAQQILHEISGPQNIVVKARQIGTSVYYASQYFLDILLYPPMKFAIISYDKDASARHLERIRTFYNNLPEAVQADFPIHHDSKYEMSFPAIGSAIWIGTAGCLHPDSTVLTEGGHVEAISTLREGDRVSTGRGRNLSQVERVIANPYSGKMLKFTVRGNPSTPITVTPNHEFRVHKKWNRADKIVSPLNSRGKRVCYFIKPIRDGIKHIKGLETTRELGWVLGLYLAEGWYGGCYTSFGLNSKETAYRDTLKSFAEKHGYTFRWRPKGGVGPNGMEVSIGSKPFMELVGDMFGKDKEVPEWFWDCGTEFLNGVIDGYVAGDGCTADGRTRVTSVRPHLLYQLRDMLLSTRKMYSGVYECSPHKGLGKVNKPLWELNFPLTQGIKFHQHKKSQRSKQLYEYVSIPIKCEEIEYSGFVWDITCGGSFSTPTCLVHNSSTFGRGDTWHRVLATEYAQWAPLECENMRDGLIPSIPKDSGAITIESSPRGEGTDQHIMYMDAKEGKSSFTPVFIPWFYCDDYTLPPGHILALATSKHDFDYTDEEVILVRDFNLDKAQIRWRRHQIAALRSKEIFLQEFPEDDVSCFRSFASDIFDREELTRLLIGVVKPDRIDADGVQWWAGVQPLRTYILSADTSTGWGEDPSVGLLLDVTDYPVVTHIATLGGWFKERKDIAGYWRNDEFAAKLVRLATRANRCEIVVERNETGHSVLNSIINTIQYGRVYHSVDPMTGTIGKPGWLTNAPSKRIMIDEGMKVLGSSSIRTWDEELVKELRMYRRNEDGTFSAPPGRHDDRVMALLMGLVRATDTPRLTIRSGSNVQFFGASRGRMDVKRYSRRSLRE